MRRGRIGALSEQAHGLGNAAVAQDSVQEVGRPAVRRARRSAQRRDVRSSTPSR